MQDASLNTVNAAAVVLAAAERSSTGLRHHHHHQQLDDHTSATKKRWWSRLTEKLCFRPHGHPRRIADDAGPTSPQPDVPAGHTAAYVHHAPQPVFAFVAPPSSPASSLLASESEAPSPVLLLHASAYSSPTAGCPHSIFAIGPYAHGPQQLVSPPVLYSTFTTEPSTAPLTPPPDLHLVTNPSSPEVPFARFLTSSAISEQHCGGEGFHVYQLHPGSPIGGAPLVSPGSGCSTASSPRLFGIAEQPPRILGPEEMLSRKLHRLRARNEGSLLDGHIPVASSGQEQAIRRVVSVEVSEEAGCSARLCVEDDELPKSGEFAFGNADGGTTPLEDMDGEARKKWSFFPVMENGMI